MTPLLPGLPGGGHFYIELTAAVLCLGLKLGFISE